MSYHVKIGLSDGENIKREAPVSEVVLKMDSSIKTWNKKD